MWLAATYQIQTKPSCGRLFFIYLFIYLFIHYYATEAARITLQTYKNKTLGNDEEQFMIGGLWGRLYENLKNLRRSLLFSKHYLFTLIVRRSNQ